MAGNLTAYNLDTLADKLTIPPRFLQKVIDRGGLTCFVRTDGIIVVSDSAVEDFRERHERASNDVAKALSTDSRKALIRANLGKSTGVSEAEMVELGC